MLLGESSLRAVQLGLVLGLLAHYQIITHDVACLAVLVATVLAPIKILVFPGARAALTEAQRRLLARFLLAATKDGAPYDLHDHLHLEPPTEGAPLALRLKLTPELHNFFGSLHGGAAASAVDVATTAAIVAAGGYPGVSTSLGVSYLVGCGPHEEIRLVPTVLKLGATLAYTECKLHRVSDGVLMARGWHVKHVAPPDAVARAALALRPSLKARLAEWLLARGGLRLGSLLRVRIGDGRAALAAASGSEAAAVPAPFDAKVEADTGLSRDEAGKATYFGSLAAKGTPMQGWDRPLGGGALLLTSGGRASGDAVPATWRLEVGREHVNPYGALHGGCTASLVDILGSAAVAFGNEAECGVAVSLDVQYASAARKGDELEWEATILKRGKRLVTAEVRAFALPRKRRGGGGGGGGEGGAKRLIAVGVVTKSMKGPGK